MHEFRKIGKGTSCCRHERPGFCMQILSSQILSSNSSAATQAWCPRRKHPTGPFCSDDNNQIGRLTHVEVPTLGILCALAASLVSMPALAGNGVTQLNQESSANLTTVFPVGTTPFGVAFDGENIWIVNGGNNNVTKLRTNDGAVLGTFNVGHSPIGAAFDGANIWVANSNDNTVTKLRASNGTVIGTYAAGQGPGGLAFDGANIWVTNTPDQVTKLRVSDGATLGTFTVGQFPTHLALYGRDIWVTNTSSSKVPSSGLAMVQR